MDLGIVACSDEMLYVIIESCIFIFRFCVFSNCYWWGKYDLLL